MRNVNDINLDDPLLTVRTLTEDGEIEAEYFVYGEIADYISYTTEKQGWEMFDRYKAVAENNFANLGWISAVQLIGRSGTVIHEERIGN